MVCLRNICINTLHKGDDDDNKNNNEIPFLFIDVPFQGQMFDYRNSKTYRHNVTKDNKQNTNETDNKYTKTKR